MPARGDMRSAFRIRNCIRNKKYVNAPLIPMECDTFVTVFGMSIVYLNKMIYSSSRVDSDEKFIQCFGRRTLRGQTIWRISLKWEDNIKINLKAVFCEVVYGVYVI
jgi:hypothetical protein